MAGRTKAFGAMLCGSLLAVLPMIEIERARAEPAPERRPCPVEMEEELLPEEVATIAPPNPGVALNAFVAQHVRFPRGSDSGDERRLYQSISRAVQLGSPFLADLNYSSKLILRQQRFYRRARERMEKILQVASVPYAPPLVAKLAVWASLEPKFRLFMGRATDDRRP